MNKYELAMTAVSDIGKKEPSALTVCLLGVGTVFVGLICIIAICMIMSWIIRKMSRKTESSIPAALAEEEIPNRRELIAAVSAALAEELGEDVSSIRILSVKKL